MRDSCWCAKRHQKGYTDVSQTRMQDSAFNVESQRIYSCCCIAIFNEWSRKDHSARQNLLEGTEIPDFWKIRRVHKCFLKRISHPQRSLSEETKEFKEEQTVWNRFSWILELAKMDLPIRSCAIKNTCMLSLCRAVVIITQRIAFLIHFYWLLFKCLRISLVQSLLHSL